MNYSRLPNLTAVTSLSRTAVHRLDQHTLWAMNPDPLLRGADRAELAAERLRRAGSRGFRPTHPAPALDSTT